MKYLIDTHILLWWYLGSPNLTEPHRQILLGAPANNTRLGLSSISLWEVAKLVSSGKVSLTFQVDHWFQELENDVVVEILPLTGAIALESTRLGRDFPKDPADQVIVATARVHGLRLLTSDESIIESNTVSVV